MRKQISCTLQVTTNSLILKLITMVIVYFFQNLDVKKKKKDQIILLTFPVIICALEDPG